MTSTNGRTGETRRSGRSAGQWMLVLLIVLAVAASILMVFTDELSIAGSLAVIAALWAAVIGAILVTKFRRQTETVEAKNRDLRLVYELQLEREIAARRQYELDVEMAIRREVGEESNAELAELKAQVLALRSSLESLIGEPLPEGRTALPSEKVRELASGLGSAPRFGAATSTSADGYGDYADDVVAARDFAERVPAAGSESAGATPADLVDPNERTTVIQVVGDDDPMSGRIATEVPLDEATAAPHDDDVTDADIDEAHTDDAEEVASVAATADPAPVESAPADDTPAPATPAEQARPTGVGSVPSWFGRTGARSGSHSRETAPYPGAWSVAPTAADETVTESAEPTAAQTAAPYVDDTPTDEWQRQPAPVPDLSAPEPTPVRRRGRHEVQATEPARTNDTTNIAAAGEAGGRRRRPATEGADGGHSVGRPASELLNALRESGGSGRRRRQD